MFHRDTTITGTTEVSGGVQTNRLPNFGDCPRLIEIERGWMIPDPKNKDGPRIRVLVNYFDTTWRIVSTAEDADKSSGFFWQWFLSFVSS